MKLGLSVMSVPPRLRSDLDARAEKRGYEPVIGRDHELCPVDFGARNSPRRPSYVVPDQRRNSLGMVAKTKLPLPQRPARTLSSPRVFVESESR